MTENQSCFRKSRMLALPAFEGRLHRHPQLHQRERVSVNLLKGLLAQTAPALVRVFIADVSARPIAQSQLHLPIGRPHAFHSVTQKNNQRLRTTLNRMLEFSQSHCCWKSTAFKNFRFGPEAPCFHAIRSTGRPVSRLACVRCAKLIRRCEIDRVVALTDAGAPGCEKATAVRIDAELNSWLVVRPLPSR